MYNLLIFLIPEIYDENVLQCRTDVTKRLIFRPTWIIFFQQQKISSERDSNTRPQDLQSHALPSELSEDWC